MSKKLSQEVHLKTIPDMCCPNLPRGKKKEDAISILKTCIFFF